MHISLDVHKRHRNMLDIDRGAYLQQRPVVDREDENPRVLAGRQSGTELERDGHDVRNPDGLTYDRDKIRALAARAVVGLQRRVPLAYACGAGFGVRDGARRDVPDHEPLEVVRLLGPRRDQDREECLRAPGRVSVDAEFLRGEHLERADVCVRPVPERSELPRNLGRCGQPRLRLPRALGPVPRPVRFLAVSSLEVQ